MKNILNNLLFKVVCGIGIGINQSVLSDSSDSSDLSE